MAVSPSIVSGRVVATMIFSSMRVFNHTPHKMSLKLTRILDRVRERRKGTELELFFHIISGDIQQCPPVDLLLIDLQTNKR